MWSMPAPNTDKFPSSYRRECVFLLGLPNKYWSIIYWFVMKAHTLIYTCLATCFCTWQAMKVYFLDMVWPFFTLFFLFFRNTHTHIDTHICCNLAPVLLLLWGRRTLCAGREEGFDVINIRFQLFHCELSSWVAALTDFLLLMQSHSFLPPHPFPLPLYLLSAHYSSFYTSVSPFTPFLHLLPIFSLLLFSFPPLSSIFHSS